MPSSESDPLWICLTPPPFQMSLASCVLTWGAFLACTSHALSTSKQEIMGLLLGNWTKDENQGLHVTVEHVMVLTRTDKQPDRCEVSVEQLGAASTVAEQMSKRLGKTVRVCGWYHSHPAITVLPSHVDVRTQMQYQLMDSGFIGLIFAVFQQDGHKVGKIEVTAFQSSSGGGGGASESKQSSSSAPPSDWVGRNIPLSIQRPPSGSDGCDNGGSTVPLSDALHVLCGLQSTLFDEERAAFLSALQQHSGVVASAAAAAGGHEELLEQLYCSAVYSKSLVSLLGESMLPLLQTLEAHAHNLEAKASDMERENEVLRASLTPAQQAQAAKAVGRLQHVSVADGLL